ncbi:hypothetical protein ASF38_07015 [Aeromicrobium sp. Leaf272]|nr:hypothetical protein ASF38_07015 [Aeromicrobium sp. Leaf272]
MITPGCTTATRSSTSIERIRSSRRVLRTTDPAGALAPPASPVPAPRVTTARPASSAATTQAATSRVVRGDSTATGSARSTSWASSCANPATTSGSVCTTSAGRRPSAEVSVVP